MRGEGLNLKIKKKCPKCKCEYWVDDFGACGFRAEYCLACQPTMSRDNELLSMKLHASTVASHGLFSAEAVGSSMLRHPHCDPPTCSGCGKEKDEDDGVLCNQCQRKRGKEEECDREISKLQDRLHAEGPGGMIEDLDYFHRECNRIRRRYGVEEW